MARMDNCSWCGEDMPYEQGRSICTVCEQEGVEDEFDTGHRSMADTLFGLKMEEEGE
jgi:hypothetical protein